MASSSSNSQSPLSCNSGKAYSRSIATNEHGLVCGHGLPAKSCFSRTSGKRFFGCQMWPATCGFMVFEEDLVAAKSCSNCEEYQARLSEKDKRIADLEEEVKAVTKKKLKWKGRKQDLEVKLTDMGSELKSMTSYMQEILGVGSELKSMNSHMQQMLGRAAIALVVVFCIVCVRIIVDLGMKQ